MVHAQQKVNVTAANSVNNEIYSVTFAGTSGSTTVLNTDEKSLYSLQSLVFIPNVNTSTSPPTYSFDLLAADNQNGKILRYVGDFSSVNGNSPVTTGQVVSQAASIIYPTGLSVDVAGDLFVVDNAPGHSPQPQVWVLPANLVSGGFNNAVRIDTAGSFSNLQATVETLIVGPALGVSAPSVCPGTASTCANTGDLLVLTTNPASVLRYAGSGGNGPLVATTPTTLIGQCPATPVCIPAGTVPAGIAVWPEDNSLLISTQSGSILRYSFSGSTATQLADFIDGLPTGLYKIKTGYQGGLARAFVVQSGPGNHGSVLELGPSVPFGAIGLIATVTTGVAAPEGIAVTNTVQAPASTCQQNSTGTGGCDLLGGSTADIVLKHTVNGGTTLRGQIVENVCVVPKDPRQPSTSGLLCGDATLSVNQVCPGFDNTGNNLVIPGYLCGQSGSTGTGFALIKTLTDPTQYDQTYVENAADSDSLLPPPSPNGSNPVCGPPQLNTDVNHPIGTLVWAPLGGEGTIVEGSNMVDITSGCGTSHGGTNHMSLWATGLALDTSAFELQGGLGMPLWNLAQTKYNNLTSTVANMTAASPANITPPASNELYTQGTPPTGCLGVSLTDFLNGITQGGAAQTADFQNAANLLTNADSTGGTTCDSIVTSNYSSFHQSLGTTPPVLNPSGQIRGRLANLYYTINTLILGNPASADWPPPVSVNVIPTAVTLASNTSPGSATLYWNTNGATGCSLSSSDGYYGGAALSSPTPTLTIPAADAGTIVEYTVSCTGGPAASSVSAYVNVSAPPAHIAISIKPVYDLDIGDPGTLSWSLSGGATACKVSGSSLSAFSVTASGSTQVVWKTAGTYTYTLSCTNPSTPVSTSVVITNSK